MSLFMIGWTGFVAMLSTALSVLYITEGDTVFGIFWAGLAVTWLGLTVGQAKIYGLKKETNAMQRINRYR